MMNNEDWYRREKNFYLDSEGQIYSETRGKVRNREGEIRVNDLEDFKKDLIKIHHPFKVVEFILAELRIKIALEGL